MSLGTLNGQVGGNIFSPRIDGDPLVDCDTCEIICFGTDYGDLTIQGNRMSGTVESEDCITGEFDSVKVNLTRSSLTSSIQTSKGGEKLKRSSIFRAK
jgi:hypothetical protein